MSTKSENSMLSQNDSSAKLSYYHRMMPLRSNPDLREALLEEAKAEGLTEFQVDPGRREILGAIEQGGYYYWAIDVPMLLALPDLIREGLIKFIGMQGILACYRKS